MSEDIVKESIKCLANMEIKETTYQVARSVVLDEIERLKKENKILKESLGIKSPSKEMLEGKYWETKEIKRLNNIIKQIYKIFEEGRFEDNCDCIQIEELITRELKGSD